MEKVLELKDNYARIKTQDDVLKNIKHINVHYEQENFILFCLDTKNHLIRTEIIFKGGLNSCVVDIRTLFRIALRCNSSSIIISHNHPSGDLTPSTEDIDIYKLIKNAGDVIGIKCIDSIIFNDRNQYYSMNGVV